ncbi:phage holin family protein [Pseudomonas nicosulfuronedens]|uniref:HP1 family phage holin n=1 Tax=Pseudomonas nicosulfuronedens TaxID=2571105 RepID=UPI002449F56B|nr:HP1 family phage holin [Pseudomonas nicosulfuronedens]MDH1009998.1 phage holin family protein [Pseudomonas nicosulfuronedens]MDH1978974.1 phage holin family protein [Pseudomonas nicosulfuronedens]MDH2028347.1 phage holin family protein [Pseudomonas nicosulfuronedens]
MSDKVMSATSYAGAAAAAVSALTLTDIGIIVGIVTALLTFGANMIYQYRKDRREERLHELEVARLCRLNDLKGDPSCLPAEVE